jgi:glycosyltransferase involved in cell wall biosynthesis
VNKLIYIVNQYSKDQDSHFYHIPHLLEKIAALNVEIVLIIEKANGKPEFKNKNITVMVQKQISPIKRIVELFFILKKLNKNGFKKVFIRISQNAAIPAVVVTKLFGGEVYYWQSGTTAVFKKPWSFGKEWIKNIVKSDIPFYITKKSVNYFVTGPESMLDYYRNFVGVDKRKLLLLYNDINLERFFPVKNEQKAEIMSELGLNVDEKIILFVHRLSPVRKTLYYMPYVFDNLLSIMEDNHYKCVVIGDGSEKNLLEKLIEERNIGHLIKVLGGKPNSIIQQYYKIADIFINPTYTEGFPRVLLEAMASGLPIVSTNAGGIKDIFGDKQLCYMVDINDRDTFSEKLLELMKNNEVRKELSSENINRVKRYSTENVAKMYVKSMFNHD